MQKKLRVLYQVINTINMRVEYSHFSIQDDNNLPPMPLFSGTQRRTWSTEQEG